MNIKMVHEVFAELQGKALATWYAPEKIDRVLYLVINDIFSHWLDHYVKTNKIDDYLIPFKKGEEITLTAGAGELPADYSHVRTVYTMSDKEVTILGDKFWSNRANSKVSPPRADAPIGQIEATASGIRLQVLPTTLPKVKMFYFKVPTQPKYAYTVVGTRYVFDPANSVDVDFPIGLYPEVVTRLLNYFGIKLREQQMVQVTEQLKVQEQLK